MLQFKVDGARCTRCGECVRDCPSRIIELPEGALPLIRAESEERCIGCQHCLAVCPTGAVSIFGLDPDASVPLKKGSLPTLDKMETLVRGRRSVRRYRDANVDPALIKRLLAALAHAPSGVNRRALTFSVIDDKDVMQRFRLKALNGLAEAGKAGRVPPQYDYLMRAAQVWFDHGIDVLFRGAPHMLVVSAGPEAACPHEDVALALAYFELLARSAGLGTVWCGLARMAMDVLPELKEAAGVPPDRPFYAMLFGPPAVRYPRTVQRNDAARVHRIAV